MSEKKSAEVEALETIVVVEALASLKAGREYLETERMLHVIEGDITPGQDHLVRIHEARAQAAHARHLAYDADHRLVAASARLEKAMERVK